MASGIRYPKLACFVGASWLTVAYANTILSAGNLGEAGVAVDARALAMGGAATALFDGKNVNAYNPAVPASYGRAVFNLTLTRGYNSYRTAFGRSVEISYDAPSAELTIPTGAATAATVRFAQRYNQNYDFTRPLENEGEEIGLSRRTGRGGVYEFGAGLAWAVTPAWLVGAAVGYNFGAPKDIYTKDFFAKGYSDITETVEADYKGVSGRVGVGARINDKWSAGAVIEGAPRWRVHEATYTEYATVRESDHIFTVPWSVGVGAAFVVGPRGRLAADARFTRWSAFKVDREPFGYRDTVTFGGGAEGRITTARKTFFLLRMPYRAGVFYEPWPARDRGALARVGGAVGAGYLFLNNEESRLDFTVEYSRRGSLGANGLREEFYNFYLSVVGLETWLGRKEEE